MPRLVLYEDDGRELFAGDVSRENVETIARFLQRNMGALRAAAAFKTALGSLAELLLTPTPAPKLPARHEPRRRGGRR